ncbi:MAG TPA: hypothetical protein VF017_09740 [Thermoanaerobaculia bacterium]|nr:hypothetical protein [Thermoanaerobaculia bacterium]
MKPTVHWWLPPCLIVANLLLAAGSAQAQRACQDNFTETGDWSSGKSFKTFVETKDTTSEKAFLAVARTIASEGFLGLTSNKEIGIVSAYQEDNGKKSPITAVVSEEGAGVVRVEATITLARGLRSPSAAMRDYLCKIVEPALSATEKAASGPQSSGIAIRTATAEVSLPVVVGEFRKAGGGPIMVLYFDFPGAKAETRSGSRRPILLVRSQEDPARSYLLVKCDSDEDDGRRSVKAGSAGTLLKMGFTGKGDLAPDEDWTLPFTSAPESQGLWRVVPDANLEPGEYGLWDIKGVGAALFGVD